MWLINALDLAASVLVLAGLVLGGLTLMVARSRLQQEREAARQIQRESTEAFQHGEAYDRRPRSGSVECGVG